MPPPPSPACAFPLPPCWPPIPPAQPPRSGTSVAGPFAAPPTPPAPEPSPRPPCAPFCPNAPPPPPDAPPEGLLSAPLLPVPPPQMPYDPPGPAVPRSASALITPATVAFPYTARITGLFPVISSVFPAVTVSAANGSTIASGYPPPGVRV